MHVLSAPSHQFNVNILFEHSVGRCCLEKPWLPAHFRHNYLLHFQVQKNLGGGGGGGTAPLVPMSMAQFLPGVEFSIAYEPKQALYFCVPISLCTLRAGYVAEGTTCTFLAATMPYAVHQSILYCSASPTPHLIECVAMKQFLHVHPTDVWPRGRVTLSTSCVGR